MPKNTDKALDGIIDAIKTIVDGKINEGPFDITKNAKITQSLGNNTYDILLDNNTYRKIKSNGDTSYNVNDVVKVMIPQNNPSLMFILGGGGSGSAIATVYGDLSGKPQINSITLNGGNNTFTTANIPDSTDKRYVTDAQITKVNNTSGTNTGDETISTLGTKISGSTSKTTPVDADVIALSDSAASNILKKLSWANIKGTLKIYFDTLYAIVGHTHTSTNITDFDVEVSNNTDVAANTSARHTHSNKSILDNTTASYTTAEQTKLSGIDTNANNYSHPTQTAITSNNSNGVVIQDISIDTLGHTTSVGIVDLDGRYYTETEVNNLLNSKQSTSEKGVANGYASLDSAGKVPSTQLPSYVDDVLEYANLASFPVTGESGKIYIALDTNKTYRWGGSAYVYITSGAVDSVDGQTGIVNLSNVYEPKNTNIQTHISSTSNPHNVTTSQIGAEPAFTKNTAFNKNFGTTAGTVTEGNHVGSTGSSHGVATTSVNGFMSSTDKTKLDGVAVGANNYTLPVATATLGGVKSGTDITVDASGNVSVNDDSHNHVISNVDGLQTALDGKEPTISKNTAFNVNFETVSTNIKMDGTQSVGALSTVARADHVHPTDTSRASTAVATTSVNGLMSSTDKTKLDGIESGATADMTANEILTAIKTVDGTTSGLDADLLDGQHGSYYAPISSPSFSGVPTAPTAPNGTNTTQIATTEFVQAAVSASGGGDMLKSTYDPTNKNADAFNMDNMVSGVTNKVVTEPEKATWNGKQDALPAGTTSQFLRGDKTFQAVTKSNVGLGSVQNYGIATQLEAEAGASNIKYMTPLRVKESIISNTSEFTIIKTQLSEPIGLSENDIWFKIL